jgi:tetratricopeptide (TPR) repeat protein
MRAAIPAACGLVLTATFCFSGPKESSARAEGERTESRSEKRWGWLPSAFIEDKWHEASTANFVLVTNASRDRAESIVLTLERFRAALGQVLPEMRRWTSRRTRVFGFRDGESFAPFLPRRPDETGSPVSGYFVTGSGDDLIALSLEGGPPAFERTLFHEYIHLVLSLNDLDLPLWLEEGLSELYAGSRLSEDEAEVGVPNPRHRALLARSPPIPLGKLLSAETSGDSAALFYAESWALAHYLLVEKGEGPLGLARWLALDPSEIETAFAEYLRRSRWRSIQVELSPPDRAVAVARKLSPAEAHQRWGELLLSSSKLVEAEACLEEAVRLDPGLGPAWESLGLLALEKADPERAQLQMEKAIELGSASARGLTRYAEILIGDATTRVDSIPDDVARKARSALRQSLALEPSARRSLELLAFLYLVRGERLGEAESLIASALSIAPGDPALLFLEGQLLAQRGEYDRAKESLERAAATTEDARLREEAKAFLARMTAARRAPAR